MARSMRLARAAGLAAMLGGMACAVHAAPFAAQLRVVVQPGAADGAWSSHPGVTFQKSGECVYSASPTASTAWPVSPDLIKGGGKATAPLFNPGFPQPGGTYLSNSNDDGFNTLFYQAEGGTEALTIVCRGTILANGKDVTAATPGRVVAQTVASVGAFGPPTVTVKLDPQKLTMALPLPPGRPTGSSGRAAEPKIYKQGAGVVVKPGSGFDLDGVGGVQEVTLHDYSPPAPPHFKGLYDASLVLQGAQHGYAACKVAAYPTSPKALPVSNGSSYCVRTSEGRFAEFKVESTSIGSPTKPGIVVVISYTVWEK